MIVTMLRYIGDGSHLEHGRAYHCKIYAFGKDPTNCNITVEVNDPWKGLISMQILYSSMANYLMDWKSA